MKVLVCDDMPERCAEMAGSIREAGQPDPEQLCGDDLTKELGKLFDGVRECFNDRTRFQQLPKLRFGDADIVVLDNNLAGLHVTGGRLTAESIAGYVRAFTVAPYIVSLNKNPDVDFDLQYLVGDYSTRADLALNTNHLANPALWTGNQADAKDGFLPWYWPQLEKAVARRRKQIEFVREHLDDSVTGTLDFDDDAVDFLSPRARGALSPKAESDGVSKDGVPIKKLTFRHVFIAKDRSLPAQVERMQLFQAEMSGNTVIRDIIARIVAADIDLWFRLDVLGPQEPLVDVPHLLMRLPFLLGKRANDLKEWNRCVGADTAPYGMEQQLYEDHLAKAQFQHAAWVPAPCFWWPKLKADDRLNELFFAAKEGEWADVVFCEDSSTFLERIPKDGAAPIEFPAELEGGWERRHVARIGGYHYAPRSRLAI